MRCRHCGSDSIRHFKAIHAEGTTEVSVSASANPVWNNQPFSVHGKQKLKGSAQLQTELAKRCSPPSDPQPLVLFLAAFPGLLLGGYLGFQAGSNWSSFWLGVLCFFVSRFTLILSADWLWKNYLGGRKSMQQYQAALNQWQNSWYCGKCAKVSIF